MTNSDFCEAGLFVKSSVGIVENVVFQKLRLLILNEPFQFYHFEEK